MPMTVTFCPRMSPFRVGSSIEGTNVRVRWVIADGYYLYKHKIEILAESPDLVVGAADLPAGQMKTDQYLGTQEIYTQQVEATVPYTRSDAGAHPDANQGDLPRLCRSGIMLSARSPGCCFQA